MPHFCSFEVISIWMRLCNYAKFKQQLNNHTHRSFFCKLQWHSLTKKTVLLLLSFKSGSFFGSVIVFLRCVQNLLCSTKKKKKIDEHQNSWLKESGFMYVPLCKKTQPPSIWSTSVLAFVNPHMNCFKFAKNQC